VRDLIWRLKITFGRTTGRIAHHASRATGEGDRMMAGELKSTQNEEWDEIADVQ
jgi:hypothetical protein